MKNGYDFGRNFYFEGIDFFVEASYKDEKLLVSAEIKNKDAELVAIITDNKWSVNNNPIVAKERNYNSYAFEVIDSRNIPILQVVMMPENKILVGGVFYGENSTLVAMLNGTTIFNPSDSTYDQTIFQYPSDSNLGKLIENSPYAFGNQVVLAPNLIIIIGYVLFGIGSFCIAIGGFDIFKKKTI